MSNVETIDEARLNEFRGIKALVFDMDGTLVDSEINTERAVEKLIKENALSDEGLDYKQFYGITWKSIGDILRERYPNLADKSVEESLQETFHDLFADTPYIPGAPELFLKAGAIMPVAIGTSSNRESADSLIKRMQAEKACHLRISAEDYSKSKPDPECYVLAAERLGVAPAACLIFEDSIPGLRAAKAAGAKAIAVTTRSSDPKLAEEIADLAIRDYLSLPENFLQLIRSPRSA